MGLSVLSDLEHRIDHLETLSALPPGHHSRSVDKDVLCTPLGFIFGSNITEK